MRQKGGDVDRVVLYKWTKHFTDFIKDRASSNRRANVAHDNMRSAALSAQRRHRVMLS